MVDLQCAFDALDDTEKDGDDENQDGHPEVIPLHAVSPIVPPLGQRSRRSVVVGLLQDDQPVAPEVEAFNLPLLGLQISAEREARINRLVLLLGLEPQEPFSLRRAEALPLMPAELGLGEEKGERPQGFVYKAVREQRAVIFLAPAFPCYESMARLVTYSCCSSRKDA